MNTTLPSSQKTFVDRLLDWSLVRTRLSQYAAIAENFPYETLRAHSATGPYYCHYMSWRLGTWADDHLIARINDLLLYAQSLPCWEYERKKLGNNDFGAFWSLIWQLQVAEYLGLQGTGVSWLRSGPDLLVTLSGKQLFVECYVYHKAFDVELYLEEILSALGPDLRIQRDHHLAFSMPQGPKLTNELSRLLAPFLDDEVLSAARREAKNRYPVVLSQSKDTRLSLYVEGPCADAYDPTLLPRKSGGSGEAITVALRESEGAKRKSNSLCSHRPNMLMVNYLLSPEVQTALRTPRTKLKHSFTPRTDSDIEAIALTAAGIDAKLKRSDFWLAHSEIGTHPCHALA